MTNKLLTGKCSSYNNTSITNFKVASVVFFVLITEFILALHMYRHIAKEIHGNCALKTDIEQFVLATFKTNVGGNDLAPEILSKISKDRRVFRRKRQVVSSFLLFILYYTCRYYTCILFCSAILVHKRVNENLKLCI